MQWHEYLSAGVGLEGDGVESGDVGEEALELLVHFDRTCVDAPTPARQPPGLVSAEG